ncbi:M14 family zinc carboxypeptidase [Rhodococcus sp. MTM3W5.2]|uniref:M14 family zinc carboxypeptidase n=1 Tax=Rhodococcus sp. MTM3W5.2 TaxID=1805827 RepID=UPI0016777572|nr:M14 family zinc carboxypeptidase [Rhodococcus sp. MTM3W5.2]
MSFRSGFVSKYLDPIAADVEIRTIASAHPELCRIDTLPHRTHGYFGTRVDARGMHPMHVLRITAPGGPRRKPAVLLMRSQHAREWINALAIVETASQLVENYRPSDPNPTVHQVVQTLNRVEVLIVPESNPDGARLSFFDQGRRMWRKNLRPAPPPACPGVDCNRNFPRYFGDAGSSATSCADVYHGPAPLSEPESANIAHVATVEHSLLFAIDSHSHGQAIFRPNPGGGTYIPSLPVSPADEIVYKHLQNRMVEAIRQVQGMSYSTGTTSNHAAPPTNACSSTTTFSVSTSNAGRISSRRSNRRSPQPSRSQRRYGAFAGAPPVKPGSTSQSCCATAPQPPTTRFRRSHSSQQPTGPGTSSHCLNAGGRVCSCISNPYREQPRANKCRHCSTRDSISNGTPTNATSKSSPVQPI